MTIDKKMYENIIKERDEIISKLEEDLESQIDKLDKLVDQVNVIKTASDDLIDLIDYENNNHIIATIANFLSEQNKVEEASALSKCKLGNIFINPNLKIYSRSRLKIFNITIILYCTGDSFEKMKEPNGSAGKIRDEYNDAFNAYFTPSHVNELFRKTYKDNHSGANGGNGVIIKYELNIKRITPKESDVDMFFQKVDCLKKMLKDK